MNCTVLMKIYVWISAIFLTLLMIFFFFKQKNKSITDLDGAWIVRPVEQISNERQWKDFEFIESGISTEFLESNNMFFESDSILYAEDQNNLVVNIYNEEAKLIKSLGAGKGRGPGEFLHISDLRVDESGSIWHLIP